MKEKSMPRDDRYNGREYKQKCEDTCKHTNKHLFRKKLSGKL